MYNSRNNFSNLHLTFLIYSHVALVGDLEGDGMHSLPAGTFQAAQEELFGRGVTKVLPAMLSLMKQRPQRLLLLLGQL